ncbi:MAG: hypothetical protein DI537_23800 [Stutzerimonas stutzeri]|nr:MAG: hypothetical protein DI537_23800 [Stutzerimonas stutzeri]
MKFVSPFAIRTPSELAAGDFYEFNMDGHATFAVALDSGEGEKKFAVAIASKALDFIPRIISREGNWDEPVLFYSDAALELVRSDDSATAGDLQKESWNGVLRVTADDMLFRVFEMSPPHRHYWVDLLTFGFARARGGSDTLYITEWRLWASEADITRQDAEPLIEVKATAPKPR